MKNMKLEVSFCIIWIFLNLQPSVDCKHTHEMNWKKTSTNNGVLRGSMLQKCNSTITISSSGPSNCFQGSVLGTYLNEDDKTDRSPTWKMKV